MPISSRTPQRRPRSAQMLIATACALMVSTACSAESAPERPKKTPTLEATPLDDYDTAGLALVRGEFCERVSAGAIIAALGTEAADTASWEPGKPLPGTRDIGNEFGCSWATSSVTAQAWILAPPITPQRAADFVGEVIRPKCEELEDAPALGQPSVAQKCGPNTSTALTGYYGLVGDAWVGCEITRGSSSGTSSAEPARSARVGEWCVAVLEALRSA